VSPIQNDVIKENIARWYDFRTFKLGSIEYSLDDVIEMEMPIPVVKRRKLV
jgi:hypothetical protein